MVRRETGAKVDRSMIVSVPDWDIFKGPKDITRSRKKPLVVEQAMLEEGSQNEEHSENHSGDEMDNADEHSEEQVFRVAEGDAAEKERRTKKINECPLPSEAEEKALSTRPAKRTKIVAPRQKKAASTSKGNISKSNSISTYKAQTSNQSPPVDYTIPLNMIPPPPSQSSSSSSEDTLSDYSSDTIVEIIKKAPKPTPKPKQKTPSPKENVSEDNVILDHLTPHLSGDAFTRSNINSPNHPINKFVNATSETFTEPATQEPPITQVLAPPLNFVAP
jgi:hypothetical protein